VLSSPYFFFCRLLQSANSAAQNLLLLVFEKDISLIEDYSLGLLILTLETR